MENLFGNSIESKDETEIKQLKVSMDRSILCLQTYMEDYPTKNEMHSFILHTKSRMKKTNNTLSGISLKMETILNYAKSKKKLTRELNERISSMLEPLDRDIKNHVEEEDDLQIALNLAWEEVEEAKMLSEVKDPLLDLENCSLHELISILQKIVSDPSINTNQAGFGSYIDNHVLKEKIARYNQETMIPPKLGDIWIPKVLVTIGKETHHAILDLGSSVSVLSKELYEVLELKNALLNLHLLMIPLNMF